MNIDKLRAVITAIQTRAAKLSPRQSAAIADAMRFASLACDAADDDGVFTRDEDGAHRAWLAVCSLPGDANPLAQAAMDALDAATAAAESTRRTLSAAAVVGMATTRLRLVSR